MLTLSHTRSDVSKSPKRAIYYSEYNQADYTEQEWVLPNKEGTLPVIPLPNETHIQWLHCVGINDARTLKHVLAPYNIHELVVEDILNHKQRPKIEDYGHYIFIAARVFKYGTSRLIADQVYLILGRNFVPTFQQQPIGLLTEIRQQLAVNRMNIRQKKVDFLAYVFIDRLVDDYFITSDHYNEHVENIDKTLFKLTVKQDELLIKIHRLKRDALRIRRTLVPMRDILNELLRGEFEFFNGESKIYLRDTYDHILQLIESLDIARDTILSMMDIYLSFQSHNLNQQIRALTLITLLFMPLTVLTGIYGMNFDNIPELHWHYGYFMALGLMALIVISLLVLFRKRSWI